MSNPKKSNPPFPPVLDACCGSRMFWFDKEDDRALFVDKRCDFTALPFPDASFALVVFDPPHFERNGSSGWVGLKYGTLKGEWRDVIRAGLVECFRVLKPNGTLIFKWCADEIPVSQILALTPERPLFALIPERPLFGHKSRKQQKTHWIAFLKQNPA